MNYQRITVICSFLILLTLSAVSATAAGLRLERIDFAALSADREQVVLQLNGPYILNSFTLKGEKPRLVFDFKDARIAASIQNQTSTNGALIRQIRVGMHGGGDPKTRVVFDLAGLAGVTVHQARDDDHFSLTILLSRSRAADAPAPSPPGAVSTPPLPDAEPAGPAAAVKLEPQQPLSPPPLPGPAAKQKLAAPTIATLESIRYENSALKGEMILFQLNGFYPPTVQGVEEGVPRAVCDFANTRLGAEVKTINRIKGTYLKAIRVGQHRNPEKIRVVLDLEANNNYDLQQLFFREEKLFVIIINTIEPTPATQP
ncbi:AMIN domain-containing protein [Desulfogranum mediterraneum]|uniref:AMIN domain-containing protein n=1 Tax=Desulfogranum mediterraneum TaxID=160661 RepID=UPI0003F5C950|nr:AMIN domain-containing protein [Desulfogranum mediterraneum]